MKRKDQKQAGGGHRAWQEVLLVAIPIFVIVLAVAFSPPADKGFWATITAKPEWYFLALVFCIEGHRDRQRALDKSDDVGIFLIALAAVIAGLAAAASVAVLPAPQHASKPVAFIEGLLDKLQNPLQFFSIPLFLLSAGWSWYSKWRMNSLEAEAATQRSLREAIAQPKLYNVYKEGAVERFYDQVASVYNKRNDNTKGIREAQDRVISEIRQAARSQPTRKTSVLDIGGGTGHNLYVSLRGEDGLEWTSLDISTGMTKKFRESFPGARALNGDCMRLAECLKPNERFDAIVLSFALSSMPRSADLSVLRAYMNPGGAVFVTDIHPGYVQKSPCFDIDVDGARHALQLRKVEPLVLEQQADAAGFCRASWQIFRNERGEVYSYFIRFDAAETRAQHLTRLPVVEAGAT